MRPSWACWPGQGATGPETTRKPGVTFSNYQESKIRWRHDLLGKWVGDATTGTPVSIGTAQPPPHRADQHLLAIRRSVRARRRLFGGLLLGDPLGSGLAHLAPVVADAMCRLDFQDHPAR